MLRVLCASMSSMAGGWRQALNPEEPVYGAAVPNPLVSALVFDELPWQLGSFSQPFGKDRHGRVPMGLHQRQAARPSSRWRSGPRSRSILAPSFFMAGRPIRKGTSQGTTLARITTQLPPKCWQPCCEVGSVHAGGAKLKALAVLFSNQG